MLNRIKIKSFKSLEDVSVDLGLVNVFIGANGSGKSNLLEAIGVLGAAANGRVDDEALLRRGVRPGLPALYKSSFKGSRQPSAIRFTASNNEKAEFSVGLFNPLSNPEPAWRFKTELLIEGTIKHVGRSQRLKKIRLDPYSGYAALKAVELPENSSAGMLLKELRQFAIYSPDTATLRGLDTDPQSREPVGLGGGRLAEAVRDVFIQILRHKQFNLYESVLKLIDWANGLDVTKPDEVPVSKNIPQPTRILRFRDRFMAEGRNILSGYDASEGALYVLFMMVLVHHAESPPVFAIDNFDHSLNPRLAKALTRNLCEWATERHDRQMLLTSHNPLVLDGLPLRSDAVRLFTVERSNRGKTVVQRVEVSDQLLAKAEEGVPLSQQWVMGTFGGVPANI